MALHPERGNESCSERLYHIDMCSGSGMFGLGLKLVFGDRLRTICYIERDSRSAALIVERMEETHLDSAPLWDDVASCCCDEFVEFVRKFRPLILTAGFPCQNSSVAGKRLGKNDERYIWPYIIEFLRLVQPEYVLLENVPGLITLGLDTMVRELQEANYSVSAGLFSAAETGASHERKRLFALAVLGDAASADAKLPDDRFRERKKRDETPGAVPSRKSSEVLATNGTRKRDDTTVRKCQTGSVLQPGSSVRTLVADAGGEGLEGRLGTGAPDQRDGPQTHGSAAKFCDVLYAPGPGEFDAWRKLLAADDSLKPAIRRDAHGLAAGLDGDRLRIIGNGVLPLVVAFAFTILAAAHIARNDESP